MDDNVEMFGRGPFSKKFLVHSLPCYGEVTGIDTFPFSHGLLRSFVAGLVKSVNYFNSGVSGPIPANVNDINS